MEFLCCLNFILDLHVLNHILGHNLTDTALQSWNTHFAFTFLRTDVILFYHLRVNYRYEKIALFHCMNFR